VTFPCSYAKPSGLVKRPGRSLMRSFMPLLVNLITSVCFILLLLLLSQGQSGDRRAGWRLLTVFEVDCLRSLISAMPRAGGDLSGRAVSLIAPSALC